MSCILDVIIPPLPPLRGQSSVAEGCTCSCPSVANLTADTVTHADFEDNSAYLYLFDYLR